MARQMNHGQGAAKQTHEDQNYAVIWKAIAAVVIGVVAIAAVLWITFAIDPKDQFQQNVAWAVLA
jgi:hypothetical protein